MTYKEIFETELKKRGLKWCMSCDSVRSHKRGFVLFQAPDTVHYNSTIATRKILHRGLHEIAHGIYGKRAGLRSYQREAEAEQFATDTMHEYGVSVPRSTVARGRAYIARRKRHGDNIIESKKQSA